MDFLYGPTHTRKRFPEEAAAQEQAAGAEGRVECDAAAQIEVSMIAAARSQLFEEGVGWGSWTDAGR